LKKNNILIFGAGSIGAHHIFAAKQLKCNVKFTDINITQVEYLKNTMYPSRYKQWDKTIQYIPYKDIFLLKDKFDLIVLGIPPKHHIDLLKRCIKNLNFKKILVEKPLCVFNQNFNALKKINKKNKIFCGFNHSISKSILTLIKHLQSKKIGKVETIEINWKEDFDYVLKAHPWLKNIKQSYLSDLKSGGGGCQEYSHAIHLAVTLKKVLFVKNKFELSKNINFKSKKNIFYDYKSTIKLTNDHCKITVNIDTISKNVDKSILITGSKGKILWKRELDKGFEKIEINSNKNKTFAYYKIKRKDDFINEHIILYKMKKNNNMLKNLNLDSSIETMNIIKKLFKNV